MRVVARCIDWQKCPSEIAPYTKESQTFITIGREYEVYAVVIFTGFPSFQIIDDLGYPSWNASWLFDIIDHSLANDWSINFINEGKPVTLLGPEFIVKDADSYDAMVELEPESVKKFWQRVDALQRERSDDVVR